MFDNFNFNFISLEKMSDDDVVKQFQRAIDNNDTVAISSLIATTNDISKVNGTPLPLIHAAETGRVDILTLLLDAGVDIDAGDAKQPSACHAAISGDQYAALKLLVERGANVRVVRTPQLSLIKSVANKTDDRMTILLLDAGAPLDNLTHGDLIHLVAMPKSVGVLNRLVTRNVDVSVLRDFNGGTMCHSLIGNSARDESVSELMRASVEIARVDVNVVNTYGKTALHNAALMCNESALRILVELGADIDRPEAFNGRTALHQICGTGWDNAGFCAELLLALGADVRVVTKHGQSACHDAAKWHCADALTAFLAAGGDVDQRDSKGDTPRMIAMRDSFQLPSAGDIEAARQRIAKTRLDLVRHRALQICIGLQPLYLNALQMCEITMHSFGALGALIAFHQWWRIATAVKHFHDRKERLKNTSQI
jgi:ankyrin repeat protein